MAGVTESQPLSQIWSAVCFYLWSFIGLHTAMPICLVLSWILSRYNSRVEQLQESTKTNIITIWLIIEKHEVLCSMVLWDWCKNNCGFALLNFAIWYWNKFLNKCGHVIHHFKAHFSLFFFLLMTYYLWCILYLFEAIEMMLDKMQIQAIF